MLKIVQKIQEEYQYKTNDTFDTLLKTLARTGRIDKAIEIAQMYHIILRVGALTEIYSIIK